MKRKRLPLIGFLILAIACAIVANSLYGGIQDNIHKLNHLENNQRIALVAACERSNSTRASDNRSNEADYSFFTLTTNLLSAELKTTPAGQPTPTPAERQSTQKFITSLKRSAAAKTWEPLTNCSQAVTNGFRIPPAVPFSQAFPPKSDLP